MGPGGFERRRALGVSRGHTAGPGRVPGGGVCRSDRWNRGPGRPSGSVRAGEWGRHAGVVRPFGTAGRCRDLGGAGPGSGARPIGRCRGVGVAGADARGTEYPPTARRLRVAGHQRVACRFPAGGGRLDRGVQPGSRATRGVAGLGAVDRGPRPASGGPVVHRPGGTSWFVRTRSRGRITWTSSCREPVVPSGFTIRRASFGIAWTTACRRKR